MTEAKMGVVARVCKTADTKPSGCGSSCYVVTGDSRSLARDMYQTARAQGRDVLMVGCASQWSCNEAFSPYFTGSCKKTPTHLTAIVTTEMVAAIRVAKFQRKWNRLSAKDYKQHLSQTAQGSSSLALVHNADIIMLMDVGFEMTSDQSDSLNLLIEIVAAGSVTKRRTQRSLVVFENTLVSEPGACQRLLAAFDDPKVYDSGVLEAPPPSSWLKDAEKQKPQRLQSSADRRVILGVTDKDVDAINSLLGKEHKGVIGTGVRVRVMRAGLVVGSAVDGGGDDDGGLEAKTVERLIPIGRAGTVVYAEEGKSETGGVTIEFDCGTTLFKSFKEWNKYLVWHSYAVRLSEMYGCRVPKGTEVCMILEQVRALNARMQMHLWSIIEDVAQLRIVTL